MPLSNAPTPGMINFSEDKISLGVDTIFTLAQFDEAYFLLNLNLKYHSQVLKFCFSIEYYSYNIIRFY